MNRSMPWSEVAAIHGGQAGVTVKGGLVSSVLISLNKKDPYGNEISDDKIRYHVRRVARGDSWIAAFFRSMKEDKPLLVFQKLGVNDWMGRGPHKVTHIEDAPKECFVTLEKM